MNPAKRMTCSSFCFFGDGGGGGGTAATVDEVSSLLMGLDGVIDSKVSDSSGPYDRCLSRRVRFIMTISFSSASVSVLL